MSTARPFPESLEAALDATYTTQVQIAANPALSWNQVLERSRHVAGGLARAGLGPGDRVLLALPNSETTVLTLLGCFRLGVVPCCVSPPEGLGSRQAFLETLPSLTERLNARAVLTTDSLQPVLRDAAGAPVWSAVALESDARIERARELPPEAPLYVQLTSGSTHSPKAAVVSRRALVTNARQLSEALQIAPNDGMVSWLPLFHDMGLVGCFLTPLLLDGHLRLLRPIDFLRNPVAWLRAISECPARRVFSSAPTFALSYTVKRCAKADLSDLDLSRWSTLLVGAEAIPSQVLTRFNARFAPLGLAPTVLCPSYGLAEATLAVSSTPAGERARVRTLSRAALATQGQLADPQGPEDAREVVGCGRPLSGTAVSIVDEHGRELPPGHQGEIVVRGPSLFSGYLGDPESAPGESGLHTGDLGFLEDGHVFVTGRKKDVIILRGHNHDPSEVEWAAASVTGVRPARVAAFGVEHGDGGERLCLVFEHERGVDVQELTLAIRRAVQAASGLSLHRAQAVPRGTIPLTTSGKVRRAAARELFLAAQAPTEP